MVALNKRLEQKKKTRERILEVAYREFSRKGIAATNTSRIARAARLSHGALFVHFPTREDIILNVIDQFGIRLGSKLRMALRDKKGVAKILQAHLDVLQEYESFYAELIVYGPALPQSVRGTVLMIQGALSHHLIPALKKEMPPNHFRKLSTPLLLNTWIGLIHYYLVNRDIFSPKQSVLKKMGPQIEQHFLTLLKLK